MAVREGSVFTSREPGTNFLSLTHSNRERARLLPCSSQREKNGSDVKPINIFLSATTLRHGGKFQLFQELKNVQHFQPQADEPSYEMAQDALRIGGYKPVATYYGYLLCVPLESGCMVRTTQLFQQLFPSWDRRVYIMQMLQCMLNCCPSHAYGCRVLKINTKKA